MRTNTPIVPSRRRPRYDLEGPSNPPKIPAGVVLLRHIVRTTLLSRIGQPWAEVAAVIAKLPDRRRSALSRLVRIQTTLRDGQVHYYCGSRHRTFPMDAANLNSCGYYVCPETGSLQFMKYEPKITDACPSITG